MSHVKDKAGAHGARSPRKPVWATCSTRRHGSQTEASGREREG